MYFLNLTSYFISRKPLKTATRFTELLPVHCTVSSEFFQTENETRTLRPDDSQIKSAFLADVTALRSVSRGRRAQRKCVWVEAPQLNTLLSR